MTAPLTVGVPRERKDGEHRVAITPDGVHELAVHDVPVVGRARRGRGIVDPRRRRSPRPGPTLAGDTETCGSAPTWSSR